MESAQRALVHVLLDHIHSLGLITDVTRSRAVDLVHSSADFPELFQDPAREETAGWERARDA